MAEENEKAEKIEDKAPKKGKLKLIIILLVGLAVLGGGGAYLWFKVIAPAIGAGGGAESGKEKKERPEEIEAVTGQMFPLEPFIINLAGVEGKRFLKLSLELELNSEKLTSEVTANLPKIKDSILILLSSKTFDDIYTVEGKFKLRDEITARVNRFLVSGHVMNVYFTEFVIQ